jgi:DNA-binding transcriptional ArsR family regulator
MKLPPALWRSCRVIACETRLQLLWQLFEGGELSVNSARFLVGISQPGASTQFRALSERGFIIPRREDLRVIYRPEANSAVPFAQELLEALQNCFEQSVPFKTIIRQATAFTHERRIEIVRALNGKCLSFAELLEVTGMSSAALSRHLNKLERRRFVKRTTGFYRLRTLRNGLGRTLMECAVG